MKILTAAEMREVDRRTIEQGIPGIILMENAGSRVVDYLSEQFAPLKRRRVAIFCGKGNNGGDGFVIARQLHQRELCEELTVVEAFAAEDLRGDAAEARKMLLASGCAISREIPERALQATIVIDALLGTGISGAALGPPLDFIRAINKRFPHAEKVAVDIPSGFPTDETRAGGEYVAVGHTVTFTALKRSQAFSPSYEAMGRLRVYSIGTPAQICEHEGKYQLRLTTPQDIAPLFLPREKDSNKGLYGHVLVIGGSKEKPGAPCMTGLSVLRSGAGLVTIASAESAISSIAAASPVLMTESLPQTEAGHVALRAQEQIESLLTGMTTVALGPGLGKDPETVSLVKHLYKSIDLPMVVDADGLNALAGSDLTTDKIRILTPHPGEMSRLLGKTTKEVQAERLKVAQELARNSRAVAVLKGDRTVIAFPDGETWINPTGSPSMATGGTGDILTGMVAGLVAQFPRDLKRAVVAAVWWHGRAGEVGAAELGEKSLVATDLLDFLSQTAEELCGPV
jgi:ADP-dependent NAD(P)H-hydrate dehydratase / NAD(P)H-hydrate epimerase